MSKHAGSLEPIGEQPLAVQVAYWAETARAAQEDADRLRSRLETMRRERDDWKSSHNLACTRAAALLRRAEAAEAKLKGMSNMLGRISVVVADYFHAPAEECIADGVDAMAEHLAEAEAKLNGYALFAGPCAHGHDPWDRCETCGNGTAVEALHAAWVAVSCRLVPTVEALERLVLVCAPGMPTLTDDALDTAHAALALARGGEIEGALHGEGSPKLPPILGGHKKDGGA